MQCKSCSHAMEMRMFKRNIRISCHCWPSDVCHYREVTGAVTWWSLSQSKRMWFSILKETIFIQKSLFPWQAACCWMCHREMDPSPKESILMHFRLRPCFDKPIKMYVCWYCLKSKIIESRNMCLSVLQSAWVSFEMCKAEKTGSPECQSWNV